MKIITDLKRLRSPLVRSVVGMGVFDAMHIGHLKLLGTVKEVSRKKRLTSVLLTFDPYPKEILLGFSTRERLLTRSEKIKIAEGLGIGAIVFIRFNKYFSRISACDFATEYLLERLGLEHLVVGEDFSFGKGREGNPSYLRMLAREFGFGLSIVKTVRMSSQPVKTSLVRRLIRMGDVKGAAKFLKRYYAFEEPVIRGSGRGAKLGFPTANSKIPSKLLPRDGIYATFSKVGLKRWKSVTYIGQRATFPPPKRVVETHIFGRTGDLYRKKLRIEFVKRIRGDKRFGNAEELVKQIRVDIRKAMKLTSRVTKYVKD